MTDLIIDPEFRDLLPPLPDDKFKQLEENVLANGIREPLVLWQGILVDGHNRYEIAKRHNLPFTTIDYQFGDRNDVLLWIANNQFGRRDLTTYERSVLALKIKPVIAAKADERMKSGVKQDNPIQIFGEGYPVEKEATQESKSTAKERTTNAQIAKLAGVSDETIRKVIGTITLDPASSEIANRTVKATKFFTAEDDGLIQDWDGENIWLNPPYSSGLIEKFVDKLLATDYTQAIVLVNNATDTEWFSRLAEMAEAVVFPKGRIKFYKPDGTTGAPLQGQAILYFGDGIDDFKKVFSKYGRCWQ